MRHNGYLTHVGRYTFQFTHPGRGATDKERILNRLQRVSIHAPREGCDINACNVVSQIACFNSRTPGGVRHISEVITTALTEFQFTHPGRGATTSYGSAAPTIQVSIHAPREGCDANAAALERMREQFQFTHPGRGATCALFLLWLCFGRFNSRTPGGVRQGSVRRETSEAGFQFTHPGRGATSVAVPRNTLELLFQFTHPGRGATPHTSTDVIRHVVSIHAPREGCDAVAVARRPCATFQFTHPGRGATDSERSPPAEQTSFNSRTPGGVRLKLLTHQRTHILFQFTHPGRGATILTNVTATTF